MIARSFFLFSFATGAVPSDVEQDDHPQEEADVERVFVEDLGDLLLVVPDEVTEEGEDGYPHPRTESGKETEPPEVHPRQTRRKGDVLPQPRYEPPDKRTDLAVSLQKPLCPPIGTWSEADVTPEFKD